MVEHIHYKMLRNLILHITYLMSRLHSSINKRIASLFEMISAIRGARQQQPLSMNAGSTLLQRRTRTVEMLVRRCTEPDMNGSSKASQFWDADAPFASASLVEMQKSPGLEGPLEDKLRRCSTKTCDVVPTSVECKCCFMPTSSMVVLTLLVCCYDVGLTSRGRNDLGF